MSIKGVFFDLFGTLLIYGDTEVDITGSLSAGINPILIQRDQFKTVPHSVDFRAYHPSTKTQYKTKNTTGIRTIASLPELIKILE